MRCASPERPDEHLFLDFAFSLPLFSLFGPFLNFYDANSSPSECTRYFRRKLEAYFSVLQEKRHIFGLPKRLTGL
jgi:hypothetical protein